MSKFCGVIGYGVSSEVKPGVWTNGITEQEIVGDFIKNTRKLEGSSQVNQNININNVVSIIADPYMTQNFHFIKYVKYLDVKWNVKNVEVDYPRLILTLGDEYNG